MSVSKYPIVHIDGLRGIAVAVVLYHAKLLSVTVKVYRRYIFCDIRFLITLLLFVISRLEHSHFGFWERRVRRDHSGALHYILCTVIAACFLMLYQRDSHYFAIPSLRRVCPRRIYYAFDNYFDEHSRFSPLTHGLSC